MFFHRWQSSQDALYCMTNIIKNEPANAANGDKFIHSLKFSLRKDWIGSIKTQARQGDINALAGALDTPIFLCYIETKGMKPRKRDFTPGIQFNYTIVLEFTQNRGHPPQSFWYMHRDCFCEPFSNIHRIQAMFNFLLSS